MAGKTMRYSALAALLLVLGVALIGCGPKPPCEGADVTSVRSAVKPVGVVQWLDNWPVRGEGFVRESSPSCQPLGGGCAFLQRRIKSKDINVLLLAYPKNSPALGMPQETLGRK